MFGWEFNSCEMLVKGDDVYPIDYANACPDVAVTSLHYYFPWAIKALVRWSAYCLVTGRRGPMDLEMRRYFDVADRDDLDDEQKLDAYLAIADEYFETEAYWAWCDRYLPHLDAAVLEWVQSDAFRRTCCARRSSRPTRRTSGPVHGALRRAHRPLGQRREGAPRGLSRPAGVAGQHGRRIQHGRSRRSQPPRPPPMPATRLIVAAMTIVP